LVAKLECPPYGADHGRWSARRGLSETMKQPPRTIAQIGKFIAVGLLNTAIDFGVLNLLSLLTSIYGGSRLIPINIPGFVLAMMNSYVLNKYWTFKATGRRVSSLEIGTFALVSFIGLSLNTAICVVVTSLWPPALPITPVLRENIAKVLATGCSLVWNFVGYKYVVFERLDRRPKSQPI
jgi:putative flippase GtrA